MAKNEVIYRTQAGRWATTSCPTSSGGTTTTFFTAGTNGSKVYNILCLSTAVSGTNNYSIIYNNGSDNIISLGVLGSGGDLLPVTILDSNGNKYFNIEGGVTLKITLTDSSGVGNSLVTIYGEDF